MKCDEALPEVVIITGEAEPLETRHGLVNIPSNGRIKDMRHNLLFSGATLGYLVVKASMALERNTVLIRQYN